MTQLTMPFVETSTVRRKGRSVVSLAVKRDREFNVALFRLMEGRGGKIAALCVLLGMTPDQIKGRVKRVRYDYPDDIVDPTANELDDSEVRYLTKAYARSKDPAVKAFMGTIHTSKRKNPSWRGSGSQK